MTLKGRILSGLFLLFAAVSLLSYLLLSYFILAKLMPQIGGLLPFGMRILGYSAQGVDTYYQAMTHEGFALFYGPVGWWLDTVFAISFAGFLALVSIRYGRGLLLWVGVLLAALYCGIDLAENWSIRWMLNRVLVADPTLVARASDLTLSKFTMLILAVLAAFFNWRTGQAR